MASSSQETVEKCIGAGKHGSTGDFVFSSSSQLQLEETKVDSCVDSTGDIHWSRTSMGSPQWQGDIKTTSVFHNELENHINKVNVAPNEDHDSNNNFPPRFRDKKFGKYYKSQKPQPGQPKKSVNAQQFEKGASQEWDNPNWMKKQEPLPAKFNTQETNPDSDHFPQVLYQTHPRDQMVARNSKALTVPQGGVNLLTILRIGMMMDPFVGQTLLLQVEDGVGTADPKHKLCNLWPVRLGRCYLLYHKPLLS